MKTRTVKHKNIGFTVSASLVVLAGVGQTYRAILQQNKNLALTEAIRSNNTNQVLDLLASGANANTIDEPTLHFSMWRKFEDRLQDRPLHYSTAESVLLSALDWQHGYGRQACPPLHNFAVINALVTAGSDVNAHDIDGDTPLLRAVAFENIDVITLLLEHGAKTQEVTNGGYTALMVSVQCNDRSYVIELLLNHGVPIDAQDQNGYTALIWAVIARRNSDVKTLIAGHANINLRDSYGYTALHYARMQGYLGLVKLLRQAGARE